MLTRPRPSRVELGPAPQFAWPPTSSRIPPSLCASVPPSLSPSVLPYVCLNRFLDFVFLIVNTLFPRLHLLSVCPTLSLCPPWPLVQTVMICQSPCGPPICNSCFSHVFIGFLMCAPSRSLSQTTAALLRQQKVRKILFFCGKLVEINFLF